MHELWELKQRQSLPLPVKVAMSLNRIREWYEYWNGQVYVSFSGGKDSTVLLHLVRSLYPDVPAVFVDTGLEYPELKEFVKSIPNVIILRPQMTFRQVIYKHGYPIVSKEVSKRVTEYKNALKKGKLESSMAYQEFNGIRKSLSGKSLYNKSKWKFLIDAPFLISNKCCDVMKKNPAKEYEKESLRKPFIGTLASESYARETAWRKHGCNAFSAKRKISQPLSFWTEDDILQYISENNLPYASVYGKIVKDENGKWKTTGCDRTGCVFCGFGCHLQKEPNRFQQMKETHPKLYEYCMKDWDDGGLGMAKVLDYIHVKYE